MSTPVPVPPDADLRDFHFYPLEVRRLLDSALSATDAEVFRVAVLSWCVAWHQLPAGSLPDDDAALARLMGFGRDLRGWKKVRAAGGMRGWERAEDGRLYHQVVTDKVLDALAGKRKNRDKTEAARVALQRKKQDQSHGLSQRSVTDSKLREERGERTEERGQGRSTTPVTDPADEAGGTEQPVTPPQADPEQAWRMERLQPWAKALHPILGSKLGPKTWPAWKRLVERFTLERVAPATEAQEPGQRWPAEVETLLLAQQLTPGRGAPTPPPARARAAALVRQHGLARIQELTGVPLRSETEAVEALTENPTLADVVERGAA